MALALQVPVGLRFKVAIQRSGIVGLVFMNLRLVKIRQILRRVIMTPVFVKLLFLHRGLTGLVRRVWLKFLV